jgi:dipeptidyl aminopeptidase/acylaminoacyl peptidase
MLRSPVHLVPALLFVALAVARGQPGNFVGTGGPILSLQSCLFSPYDEQSAFTRRFYSREEYDSARSRPPADCFRIAYRSDGLTVAGYLVRPRGDSGRRYPVIIYNRGGFLERGKIDNWNLVDFQRLAAEGFVVLASQYRGNDGGEGREELGGADLDDVTSLSVIARALPFADGKNVFMYGLSRGGMMTFLEIRRGVPINAAVVVGAVYDLEAFGRRAPAVLAEAAKLIPDYPARGAAVLRERSAMNWPEKVDVPLMMLHGGDDDEVPATEALAFATKLSLLKKPYDLVIYANDVHEVARNRLDRDARAVAWFKRYLR